MDRPIILDAGPLGMIAHPRPNPQIAGWYKGIVGRGVKIFVAEVADYEVRRSFLLQGPKLEKALARLNEIKQDLNYLPLTTAQMLKAAELWAESWRKGQPTCDPKELDCDVYPGGPGSVGVGKGHCRNRQHQASRAFRRRQALERHKRRRLYEPALKE